MAVAISQTANPAGVSASGNVATYSDASIGVAHSDRIVYLLVASELTSASPNSATIDFGGGAVAMTAGSQGNFGVVYARIFYARAATGTTATFAITFGANPSDTQNHVAVYRGVGGAFTLSASGNDGSTDMDATDRLTTGAQTIPAGGAILAVAGGATDTGAKTWSTGEDIDEDAGAFRFTTAFSTTAGAITLTCTGSNNEDGALSWLILSPSAFVTADGGSYAVAGTVASLEHGWLVSASAGSYAVTGTDATLSKGQKIVADAGSYAISGTDATLKHDWKIVAGGSSYAVSGTDASLLHAWEVAVGSGSYAVSGIDVTLTLGGGEAPAASNTLRRWRRRGRR